MKYMITITESNSTQPISHDITVEADNPLDALLKAKEIYEKIRSASDPT